MAAPALGVNLEMLNAYDASRPFVNAAQLLGRPMAGIQPHPGPFNEDGYPLSDWSATSELTACPAGVYALSYTGKGEVSFTGRAKLTAPGQVTINPDDKNNAPTVTIKFKNVDPNNPVRNLKLLTPGENPNATFTTAFVNSLKPFKAIRFMDWGHTNRTPLMKWTDRRKPSSFSQTKIRLLNGGKSDAPGVAMEYWADLCNAVGADAWVCVPDTFDNASVSHMAKLFRNRLKPARKVYLEYSNEVWNDRFDQNGRLVASAQAAGRSKPEEHAFQTKRVADVWRTAWGAISRAASVRPVFATHTADGGGAWTKVGLNWLKANLGGPRSRTCSTPSPSAATAGRSTARRSKPPTRWTRPSPRSSRSATRSTRRSACTATRRWPRT